MLLLPLAKVINMSGHIKEWTLNAKEEYIARLRLIGEQNKETILECIAKSEPEGRSTSELSEETELHRDTIYNLSKQLENEGWVKKEGKYGKYHLTEKALDDPSIGSWIFRGEVMRSIARWSVPWAKPNKFSSLETKAPNKEYETEGELFDFANKIGALIVYILLHALRPRDVAINGSSKRKVTLSGKEKTEQARRWVENTISPRWLLFEFCRVPIIAKGLAVWAGDIPISKSIPTEVQRKVRDIQKRRRKINPQDPIWTQYELDEDTFGSLTRAFANVYPEINALLELIRKSLPDKVQKHKDWNKKYLQNRQQKKT
jgi:IclR helix-turn-helix domain